jgi:leucyl aminopeptidase
MAITITTKRAKKAHTILVPVSTDILVDIDLSQYSGLSVPITFKAEPKEQLNLIHPQTGQKIVFVGLGNGKEKPKVYSYLRSAVAAHKNKPKEQLEIVLDHLTADTVQDCIYGAILGMMQYGTYKLEKEEISSLSLFIDSKHKLAAAKGQHIAEAQINIMQLIDRPSNIKTPDHMAKNAVASGKKHGYSVKIFNEKEIQKMGCHALIAVGQGSVHPPRLIVMEYKPKGLKSKTPALGLVGKGVSFDTGGISIKPSANMGYMKCDMSGAAAVIGALEVAARLQLDIHLVGVIPAAENAVDGNSIRPGDVIGSYSGKSIEVIDTDAEGRLILADGLSYMLKHHKPEYMIDLATLTGSCVATLGAVAAGMFTHNEEMASDLYRLGEQCHDRVWRLPLHEDYMSEMHSDIADIKNLSTRPVAGATTAAKFLEFFTESHTRWAHLDIAGVAFGDSEFAKTRTATGYGIKLLLAYMQHLIQKK